MAKRRAVTAEANCEAVDFIRQARREVLREESLLKIASCNFLCRYFGLNASFGGEFELQKGVTDGVLLISIGSPPVRLKVKTAKAKGCLIVDPREDPFSTIRAIFTGKAGRLERNPIPGEQGIELVEGETRRACGANEEEVALGETGLNGSDVDGLKQLGLEQFTDPGDLVARQSSSMYRQAIGGRKS